MPVAEHRPSQTAGRKGGRPRKQRTIPPADQATQAAGRGRPPPSPDDPAWATFCAAYARGVGAEDAARAAALNPSTVANWFRWGEQGREPYRRMLQKAMTAEAIAVGIAADKVLTQRPLDWLARVRPERWAARERVEVTRADPAPIQIAPERMDEILILAGEEAKARRARTDQG